LERHAPFRHGVSPRETPELKRSALTRITPAAMEFRRAKLRSSSAPRLERHAPADMEFRMAKLRSSMRNAH
jgi:hypothetical protein